MPSLKCKSNYDTEEAIPSKILQGTFNCDERRGQQIEEGRGNQRWFFLPQMAGQHHSIQGEDGLMKGLCRFH